MANSRLSVLAPAIVAAFLVPSGITAQTPAAKPNPTASPAKWTAPRLPDGRPDFSGYWSGHTATPLERPDSFAGREFLTDEEFKTMEQRAGRPAPANPNNPFPPLFTGESRWLMTNKRTSVITDPKDGKLPPLTPEAQRKREADAAAHKLNYHGGPEEMTTLERCIVSTTSGPPMLASFYNNNYQIVQTRDHLAIATEMVNDVRIIPLAARPVDGQPRDNFRQWKGDSRGHWEGDTLVVETTSFNGRRGYIGPPTFDGNDLKRPDEKMTVVERFSRTEPGILLYQFTVNDPGIYSRPWSGEITMRAFPGPLLEYACKEGDQSMELILSGARADEKAAGRK